MHFFSYNSFLKFFLLFFLPVQIISGQLAFAGSSPASIAYEKARVSYQSFFQSKKKMHRRDQWILII
ncbi:uncharacterized protein METZ01_LOCUS239635, partial [marine metagenome]